MDKFVQINWKSTNSIKNDINMENYFHKYELCIELSKKKRTNNDIVLSKYFPIQILKYPININKKDELSNGRIYLHKNDFKQLLNINDIVNMYITDTKINNNNILNIKKIKISSSCIQNELNYINNLPQYNKLYLKLDTACNNETCNNATISSNESLFSKNF